MEPVRLMPTENDVPGMFDRFDFDAWSELARRDPSAFEEARRAAVDALIAGSTGKNQLLRLQWRVDGERRRAKVPLKACLVLSGMMWEAVNKLHGALIDLAVTGETLHRERAKLRPWTEPR
jgi:Protein of unknown function (DUF3135)